MRKVVLIFSILLVIFLSYFQANAQTHGDSPQPDDKFNVFLLFLATAFMCVVFGAAIIGAFAATFHLMVHINYKYHKIFHYKKI